MSLKWYGNWCHVRKKGGKKTVFMTKTTSDRKERDRVRVVSGHNVFIMQSKKILRGLPGCCSVGSE